MTDAWKSIAKQFYVGLTCLLIDYNGELQNCHLCTKEIEQWRASQNLREHIQKELDVDENENNYDDNDDKDDIDET